MFEMLMLIGFAAAGFIHLLPAPGNPGDDSSGDIPSGVGRPGRVTAQSGRTAQGSRSGRVARESATERRQERSVRFGGVA